MKAFHAFVEGEVQGVGFRYATLRQATLQGLVGWVRNTQEGEVEVWAEGDEKELERLLAWLKHGPTYAVVSSLRWNPEKPTNRYPSFEIAF